MELIFSAVLGLLMASVVNMNFHFAKDEGVKVKFTEYLKCFYKRISYILNEAIIGGVFMGLYIYYGFTYRAVVYAFLFVVLAIISNYDIKHQTIPNDAIIVSAIIGFLLLPINRDCAVWDYVVSMLFYFLLFYFISIVTHEAIGKGDAFILGLLGLYLGFLHTLAVLLYAVMLGGAIILILFALRVIKRKTTLPFAPFLTMGFIVSVLL